ncbi:MAG: MBL fold metallo-hydrolase [Acidobacteriota bacterium]|nr:MBL fold metallo-hydrolase [Acidobacteriota bacterium]
MGTRFWLSLSLSALMTAPAAAQSVQSVLQATAIEMGMENLSSIEYSGTGWQGRVGQNVAPDRDWPRVELTAYTRAIDFDAMSSREEFVREGSTRQFTNLVSGDYAWTLDTQGEPVPQPASAELRRLEILLTPWGFIKGAMAPGANPTLLTRNEYGGRSTVISFVAFGKYRVNGTINPDGLLERTQTWVPNPVVGDMYYENVYTEYREVGGVQIPRFHQHQDYDDGAHAPNVSGGDHSFGLETVSSLMANADAAVTVPDNVMSADIEPVRVESQEVGDGVWLIAGGSHHSVAVEFGDHVTVIEAPLNEARSLAVIGEVYRLIPDKPIKFIVTTHHHWDHLGGLRAYVHEGATVVTHAGNKPYYQEVLRAGLWTLEPDLFSLHPPEEWSEGYIFETVNEKYVLADDTRRVELHHVTGLAHAAGMLIAYIPGEKILVQADLYFPTAPAPNASVRSLQRNLQRLGLDVETIVGIHQAPAPMSQFTEFVSDGQ